MVLSSHIPQIREPTTPAMTRVKPILPAFTSSPCASDNNDIWDIFNISPCKNLFSCSLCLDNPIHWFWAEIELYCQTFMERLLRMGFRDSQSTYSMPHYMFSTHNKGDVSIVLNSYHNHRPCAWYFKKFHAFTIM